MGVFFVTGLNLVLQQPSTAALAIPKADIAKKSSYCYSSCWLLLKYQIQTLNFLLNFAKKTKNIPQYLLSLPAKSVTSSDFSFLSCKI
jgi:hypothetical protein